MIEDKLSQDQRLRLECLAQANARANITTSTAGIISEADEFETYVREGKKS